MPPYRYDSRVRYSECDENGQLSLVSLVNYLQDCSTFHSEDLGVGVDVVRGQGRAWLIAAWQIQIDRLPRFCEDIRIETWCPQMVRTIATRDFIMYDTAGTPLVRAESLWFVYSFAQGRPIRVPDDQRVLIGKGPDLELPPTKRRLRVEGPAVDAPTLTVEELHLDGNRHVNNAQYLGMATNALTSVFGQREDEGGTGIARLCAQYKRQALLGDVIVPHVHTDGPVRTVDLANPEGESYAIVRIELRA